MDKIGSGDLLLREENSCANSVNMRIPLCTWIQNIDRERQSRRGQFKDIGTTMQKIQNDHKQTKTQHKIDNAICIQNNDNHEGRDIHYR